jgi:hypothetical protein
LCLRGLWIISLPEENTMKKTGFWMLAVLAVSLAAVVPTQSEIVPKTLTLVYSNNQYGEIDPCPT